MWIVQKSKWRIQIWSDSVFFHVAIIVAIIVGVNCYWCLTCHQWSFWILVWRVLSTKPSLMAIVDGTKLPSMGNCQFCAYQCKFVQFDVFDMFSQLWLWSQILTTIILGSTNTYTDSVMDSGIGTRHIINEKRDTNTVRIREKKYKYK